MFSFINKKKEEQTTLLENKLANDLSQIQNYKDFEYNENYLLNLYNIKENDYFFDFKMASEFSFIFKNNILANVDLDYIFGGLFFQDSSNELTYIHTQFLVMLILTAVLYYLSKLLSKKIFNLDKKSSYECGFEPFLILTTFIEVGFILVAFIFLIFDLELIFLSAFLVSSGSIGSFGILLCITYIWSVWLMVFFEIFTGILSWPVWNMFKINGNFLRKLNFGNWSEYISFSISSRRSLRVKQFLFKNSLTLIKGL